MGGCDQLKGIDALAFPSAVPKYWLCERVPLAVVTTSFPRLTPPILFFGFKAKPPEPPSRPRSRSPDTSAP